MAQKTEAAAFLESLEPMPTLDRSVTRMILVAQEFRTLSQDQLERMLFWRWLHRTGQMTEFPS